MTQRKIALSIEEAADYTGIGRNTLRKLVEWKKLPVLKVGRKVLIKTDMLELFIYYSICIIRNICDSGWIFCRQYHRRCWTFGY